MAAFAGAYDVAYKNGLQFTEVAGASGGSIVAVLIGAGASPGFILDCIKQLDFQKFLKPAAKSNEPKPSFGLRAWLKLAKPFKPELIDALSTALEQGGLYSSSYIEEWMNQQLSMLLPKVHGPVRFKDLPIPTFVIATELLGCKPKIWSQVHSRDDYVALAVRASCSIPFFFQPVQFGDNRLVDGGVLSNLPTFVFTQDGFATKPLSRDVLAFQLRGDYIPVKDWSALAMSRRLIDAVVDGATELQQSLQPEVKTIVIPTEGIEATDFEKMTEDNVKLLIQSGARATEDFVSNERGKTHRTSQWSCRNKDEAFAAVVDKAEDVFKEVIICQRDAEFVWKLFPTILLWRRKGIDVKVLLEPIRGMNDVKKRDEEARRSLLRNLGVVTLETDLLPQIGYVFDGTDGNRLGIILYSDRENDYLPLATCYMGAEHSNVITPVFEAVQRFFNNTATDPFIPRLVTYDKEKLESQLKQNEGFYRATGVTLTLESNVEIDSFQMCSRYMRQYKFTQIGNLVEMYKKEGLDLFGPIAVELKDKSLSLITPPVVEEHGSTRVVIEGHTRSLFCYLNGMNSIMCLVARNVNAQLPADPVEIKLARVVSQELKPEERMKNLRYNLMRRVEKAMHPVS